MKRVVAVAQLVALVCAVTFVVLLFANEPNGQAPGATAPTGSAGSDLTAADGAAVYASRCASCHGDNGGGSFGPQLAEGRVAERFPNIADQIKVISGGRAGMPSFAGRLSDAEIRAVAEYTRSL